MSIIRIEQSNPEFARDNTMTLTLNSTHLGGRQDATIYNPYSQAKDLPVVILLHGVYGNNWVWMDLGGAHLVYEKLRQQGLSEFVLVMPSDGGLSRGPIRDVILQLTKEGLLVSKNNVGASVNSVLDPSLQKLMISLRRNIEVFAIEQLKEKLTEKDFAALEKILFDLQSAFEREDFTEVTKIDISFHNYLVHKAGGDDLVNIWYPFVMRMRLNYKRITSGVECVSEHETILNALRAGDTAKAVKGLKANIR